ncbi:MAG TPA: DEAD/DEAH box helicase family protein [Phytomonospora sp.]
MAPKGAASTGWPAVERKCRDLGIRFRWWQTQVGRIILAKRPDGKYATTVGGTGLSIPRQVGKTFLVAAIIFALCLLRPKLTVLWTAHRLSTAEETFKKLQAFAKRKRIAPHVAKVVLGSGEEEIRFRNGSRILFGAREKEFGRGLDEVDVLVFDEAQILTENALDAQVPAANQSRQPEGALMLFMGTPPKPKDPGEVFGRMRSEALSGEDDDTGWVEFGAADNWLPTPLPAPLSDADWKQIAKANPSFPEDTPREAILRMRKKLGDDSFLREGGGVWDEDEVTGDLPFKRWLDLADAGAARGTAPVFGLDIADRKAWIAVAWAREDGSTHVMLANDGQPVPASRAGEECKRLTEQWRGPVAVRSGTAQDELEAAGVRTHPLKAGEFPSACRALADALDSGTIHHGNQPKLNQAVKRVVWRNVGGEGEKAWKLRDAPEVGPLAAATRAFHAVSNRPAYDLLNSVW